MTETQVFRYMAEQKEVLPKQGFFCRESNCPRKIFTEPLPGTVARYALRSCLSSEALNWITLAIGGRAGADQKLQPGYGLDD